jgi:guanylate kinase
MTAPSGPATLVSIAGGGKDALLSLLLTHYGDQFAKAVSHTTRASRPGEENGKAYHFVDHAEFDRMRKAGEFIEEVSVHGNRYGMSRAAVDTVSKQGKRCAVILDYHGLEQFRMQGLQPFAILIESPPVEIVRQRMESRGDKLQDIATRIETAERERAYFDANPDKFDARIRNDGALEAAWQQLQCVLQLQKS